MDSGESRYNLDDITWGDRNSACSRQPDYTATIGGLRGARSGGIDPSLGRHPSPRAIRVSPGDGSPINGRGDNSWFRGAELGRIGSLEGSRNPHDRARSFTDDGNCSTARKLIEHRPLAVVAWKALPILGSSLHARENCCRS